MCLKWLMGQQWTSYHKLKFKLDFVALLGRHFYPIDVLQLFIYFQAIFWISTCARDHHYNDHCRYFHNWGYFFFHSLFKSDLKCFCFHCLNQFKHGFIFGSFEDLHHQLILKLGCEKIVKVLAFEKFILFPCKLLVVIVLAWIDDLFSFHQLKLINRVAETYFLVESSGIISFFLK